MKAFTRLPHSLRQTTVHSFKFAEARQPFTIHLKEQRNFSSMVPFKPIAEHHYIIIEKPKIAEIGRSDIKEYARVRNDMDLVPAFNAFFIDEVRPGGDITEKVEIEGIQCITTQQRRNLKMKKHRR